MMMASTTLAKNKTKRKRKLVDATTEGGPVVDGMFDVTATLSAGLKSARSASTTTTATPENEFELPVTKQERKRRKDRKERFASGVEKKNKQSSHGFDPLYRPLTSVRGGSKEQKSSKVEGSQSLQDASHMVGKNQNLEKPYLRLTTFPKKEDIRPLEVLIKSLAHIKNRYIQLEDFEWANEQLKSVRQDITVQGIRNRFVLDVYETHARILLEHGDLNEFNQCQTMIRSLTEAGSSSGDIEEEEQGSIPKKKKRSHHGKKQAPPPPLLRQSPEAADEFRGYALLYALVRKTSLPRELTRCAPRTPSKSPPPPPPPPGASASSKNNKKKDKADDTRSSKKRKKSTGSAPIDVVYYSANPVSPSSKPPKKSSLTGNESVNHQANNRQYIKKEPETDESHSTSASQDEFESSYAHALKVAKAVSNDDDGCDYRTFFRLYESAPHMSAFLMDFLVKRVRDQAFNRIIAAYRPNVSVEQFREWLRFGGDGALQETRDFLRESGAVFLQEAGNAPSPMFWVDCKATRKELTSSDSGSL